ncbi:MAG TPA: hypothetical protein DEP35_11330 [Deltaproteobacteria bacterium]|nr:hypothetical protein [Deltaproteobacteria bacterium]
MVEERKLTQPDGARKPEERFKELVAIREKETQVRAKLDAARAQAKARLEAVEAEVAARHAQAMAQAQAEIQQSRAQALREAEAEAHRLLEAAEGEAKTIEANARERQRVLLERLKTELLALK